MTSGHAPSRSLLEVQATQTRLGDVGVFTRGNGLQKKDLRDRGHPCIHYGQIFTYYGTSATTSLTFVDDSFARRLKKAEPGDLIIATTSENIDDLGKAVAWLGGEPVAVSGDAFIYSHDLDPRYVSYYFQSSHFQSRKRRHISGTKVKRISGEDLARITIPVPPREVQEAIAEVLSAMEQLKAELEAELEARRQQYEFYRDSLLSFETETPRRIQLSDAAVLYGGLTGKSKQDFSGGDSRFVAYTDVFALPTLQALPSNLVRVEADERQNRVARGDVLFTASSESAAEVGMSSVVMVDPDEPLYLNSFCFGLRFDDNIDIDPRFARHLFRSTPMRQSIAKTASGVTRFNISRDRFRLLEIPLPPIADQQRIATTLDALDALVNDLTSGLPAEIAARRKQYEYYRDRLLAFEPA